MVHYRRSRRFVAVGMIVLALVTAVLVRVLSSSDLGKGLHSAVTLLAICLCGIAILRRKFRPSADCTALTVCGASFSIAFGLVTGPARVLVASEILIAALFATFVLYLSAEITASTSKSRLGR